MTTHDQTSVIRRTAGFTLIELLVVIAIIFVLLGTLLVALKTARRGAERSESLSALRGLMTAHTAYSTDHNGRLMPGYIDPADIGTGPGQIDIKARLKNGFDLAPGDVAPYVWRLAPYFDDNWAAVMKDYRDKQLIGRLETEYADGSAAGVFGPGTVGPNDLGIARMPAYGLNSIFVGGDSTHGPADHSPWNDGKRPYVAQRLSDVLNPTKIIVFGACQAQNVPFPSPPGTDSILGYCELRAPQAYDGGGLLVSQWTIDTTSGSPTEGQVIWGAGGAGGSPLSRLGDDKIPISHLDGHVETESLSRLSVDMSRWAPNEVSQQ